jgi:hypothetical protein
LGVTIKLIAKSRIDGHLLRGSKTDEENVEQILMRVEANDPASICKLAAYYYHRL